jgi:mono/diheme cytochrome c family protein
MGTLSDAQIHRMIKEGGGALGRSPQMPPWGKVLSDREIANVTAFIRTLAVTAKK